MRFSACGKTTDCGPSSTSSVISSPRCAGRQCITSAPGFAIFTIERLIWKERKIGSRFSRSASCPMLAQTSV